MKGRKELYRWDNPVLDQAFDRMTVGIHMRKQENGSKTFLLCGCEPRTGVTTVAINAAIATSSAGWRTVLIDADLRKEGRYKHLNESGTHLARYLEGSFTKDEILYDTNHENLFYIPGGVTDKPPVSLLCSQRLGDLLSYLKESFDYIFIDAPAIGAAVDAGILGIMADDVILVAAWDRTTVSQISMAKKDMEEAGVNILGIVVNHVEFASYNHMNKNHKYFIDKGYEQDYNRAMKKLMKKLKDKRPKQKTDKKAGGDINGR